MVTSDDVAAQLSVIKYCVDHGMTEKRLKRPVLLNNIGPRLGRLCINVMEDFQWNGKRLALKKCPPLELTKGFSRPCPRLSGATGDVSKILIICPLLYEIVSTICLEINYRSTSL